MSGEPFGGIGACRRGWGFGFGFGAGFDARLAFAGLDGFARDFDFAFAVPFFFLELLDFAFALLAFFFFAFFRAAIAPPVVGF